MQVQIKITATVITSRYGTLMAGDMLRTDADFAAHLVGECKAGEYVIEPVKPEQTKTPRKAKE